MNAMVAPPTATAASAAMRTPLDAASTAIVTAVAIEAAARNLRPGMDRRATTSPPPIAPRLRAAKRSVKVPGPPPNERSANSGRVTGNTMANTPTTV